MLNIISVDGAYRLILICDWCHKPITEDIAGNYMWRVSNTPTAIKDVIFLHTSCSLPYEAAHKLPDETWEWRPLTTFVDDLLLEARTPLESIHVHVQTPATHDPLKFQPTASDPYVLVIAGDELRDHVFTLVLGGGTVLFDLDAARELLRIVVNIPREVWRMVPTLTIPEPTGAARLIFPDMMHSYEWIDGAEAFLSVSTNKDHTYASITFGKMGSAVQWIALSAHCFAALEHNQLQGLFVWLDHR